MEAQQNNPPPPFNPWDPPLPPPPPSDFEWGSTAAAFPPDGFHPLPQNRPNFPPDVDFHQFYPFNGPPDHFNGPPDHFNGPPDHFNGPRNHFNCPPDPFNGPPDHFNGPPDHFNGPPDHFNGPPDHFNGPPCQFNGPPEHFSGGGGVGFSNSNPHFRKRKFDKHDTNGGCAKLYVGAVPRNVCQEEVRHLFEVYGNVVEVVLLTDKKTGQQQEYCFVKYASVEEAEGAIAALHSQFSFPGTMAPLKVKFADGERQRLGLGPVVQQDSSLSRSGAGHHGSTFSGPVSRATEHKVYVNGLNREASRDEIVEIFSSYGVVADIHIMRDDMKYSRGCGFVGFSQRCMAMAAINGLNGTYVMRGCDKPLIVRFADPKKPKNVDSRPTPNSAEMRQSNASNSFHQGNLSTCTNLNSTGVQPGINCSGANQLRCPSHEMRPGKPSSPSRLSQISLQESQTSQSPKACIDVELNSAILSSEPISWALSGSDFSEAFEGCDWSEHICPDGDKYYFNCITSESRWEKPEEFALCEQQIQRLKVQDQSRKGLHISTNLAAPSRERDHVEAAKYEKKTCDFEKPQLSVSCAVEHSHELAQVEPSSVGGPAFVQ